MSEQPQPTEPQVNWRYDIDELKSGLCLLRSMLFDMPPSQAPHHRREAREALADCDVALARLSDWLIQAERNGRQDWPNRFRHAESAEADRPAEPPPSEPRHIPPPYQD